ncbi:hypothetical protein EYF80_036915 [Liparis tanakae]|uniref:Uncharacterized protein n=1 Tax=Liparis tanakae TaxID=230148 RepID=A0A4Z2GJI6_9TELE|nr:hypothetical protein EYF80_036915 [Liparis tanakae]
MTKRQNAATRSGYARGARVRALPPTALERFVLSAALDLVLPRQLLVLPLELGDQELPLELLLVLERHQLLLQLLLRLISGVHVDLRLQLFNTTSGRRCPLTDDRAGAGGGDRRRRVGLGTHAEGGLLLLVVVEVVVVVVGVVVHYAQVHWKDGCGGGGHLHGLHRRAHIHCWRRRRRRRKRRRPEMEWTSGEAEGVSIEITFSFD